MRIAVLANNDQLKELNTHANQSEFYLMNTMENIPGDMEALLFLKDDIIFDPGLTTKPVLLNAVCFTLKEIKAKNNVVRINGWNSFLSRDTWEIAGEISDPIEEVFSALGKHVIPVADEVGLVSARVVAMIINEAYFALEDKISSKQEIDVAMKLGTNYPYGPFEWSDLIGVDKILALLEKLSVHDKRYLPAGLLKSAANP